VRLLTFFILFFVLAAIVATHGWIMRIRASRLWRASMDVEPDDTFLELCGATGSEHARKIALAFRSSLASIARVPRTLLPARAKLFEDLGERLKIDCADWVDVRVRVERELQIHMADDHWLHLAAASRKDELELRDVIRAALRDQEKRSV
jgi:hypothetical protein